MKESLPRPLPRFFKDFRNSMIILVQFSFVAIITVISCLMYLVVLKVPL